MPPSVVPLIGGFKEVPLHFILHSLKDQKKTGVLTVSRERITKSVYFKEGDILFSVSSYANDSLRICLFREGGINFTQLKQCEEGLRDGKKKEEAILLSQGVVKPKDLFGMLRVQMQGIVLSLFDWMDAQYSFVEKTLPAEVLIGIKIDPDEVIKSGLYGVTDITRLMQCLPPLNAILLRNPQILADWAGSKEEKEVFDLIDNERSVQDILTRSGTKPLVFVQMLSILLGTGLVLYRLVSAGQRFGQVVSVGKEKGLGDDQALGSTPEVVEEESIEKRIKIIHSAYMRLPSQNYYEILGLTNDATPEIIKRTYHKMVKRYHPDRHGEEAFSGVMKKIEAIFLAVKEAYDTLSDSEERALYDDRLLAPPSSTQPQEGVKSVKDLLRRAEAAILGHDFKNAIYFFEETIRLMPEGTKKSAVYLRYGQLLSSVPSQLHMAEEALQNAARSNPEDFKPHLELGLIFKKTGLLGKAAIAFGEVLKRDPLNGVAIEEMEKLKKGKSKGG